MTHSTRHRRHRTPLVVSGLVVGAAVLGSCGFEPATNRVNTISVGTNDRSGEVEVLGAVVIAGEADLGVFAASLVDGSTEEVVRFEGLRPTPRVEELGDFVAAPIPSPGLLNLFDTGGVTVQGDFRAGDVVEVELEFSGGRGATLDVPVVTPCFQYSPRVLTSIELPGTADETIPPTEPVEGDRDPELGEGPGSYTCEIAPPVGGDA